MPTNRLTHVDVLQLNNTHFTNHNQWEEMGGALLLKYYFITALTNLKKMISSRGCKNSARPWE